MSTFYTTPCFCSTEWLWCSNGKSEKSSSFSHFPNCSEPEVLIGTRRLTVSILEVREELRRPFAYGSTKVVIIDNWLWENGVKLHSNSSTSLQQPSFSIDRSTDWNLTPWQNQRETQVQWSVRTPVGTSGTEAKLANKDTEARVEVNRRDQCSEARVGTRETKHLPKKQQRIQRNQARQNLIRPARIRSV